MSKSATVRVMSAEEIATLGTGDVPWLRLPDPSRHFPERQMRLRQLARGHVMEDFLSFQAEVAQAQQQALDKMDAVPLPSLDALAESRQENRPGLSVEHGQRDPAWHAALRHITGAVVEAAPEASRAALQELQQASTETLEEQADALLGLGASQLELAHAPLIGAALQVYWLHMLSQLQQQHPELKADELFARPELATHCPCCGSEPVASITRQQGAAMAQRYLHCALCGTEWHLQRSRCSHCMDGEKLAYQSLDLASSPDDEASVGARAAKAVIQAEECGKCRHYLKIMHTDRDPFVDPVADDLASIALDLLMADTGMTRHGHNLALIFHDTGEAAPPDSGAA